MNQIIIALVGLWVLSCVYSYYYMKRAFLERKRTEKLCNEHDKKVREIRDQLADLKSKGLKVDAKCPKCNQALRILAPFDVKDLSYFPNPQPNDADQ